MANLSPTPIQKFFTNDGQPADRYLLFTYAAGTTTKIASYQDSTGTLNSNPIVLNFRGECRLWIDPALAYKYILSPANDTDPPTNSFWTVDNITAGPANADNSAVDTGSVNNISLLIPQITAPVAFTRIIFKAAVTNTGAVTITINGGTSKNLTWQNIAPLDAGEIQAGGIYEAVYDGSQWQLQGPTLQAPQMRTAAEIAAGVTPTSYAIDTTNYLVFDRYGPDKTGATNSNAAWTRFTQVMAQHTRGGQCLITPGDYLFTSQSTLTPLDQYRYKLDAYGATFTTTGAISALKISGGTTNGGFTINGLQWKHLGDTSALAGIEIVGTARTRLNDCTARAAGVSATYAAILVRSTTPSDPNTGSYWTEINNLTMRRNFSGDGARPALGIVIQGAANATRILRGEIGDCDTPVTIKTESGQTAIANGVLIDGVAFESFTTGILCTQATAFPIGGLRIVNNRFEPAETPSTLLSLTGATSQPPTPAWLAGNYFTSDLSTYINNPNSLYVQQWDNCTNPAVAPVLDLGGAMTLRNRSGGGHVLDVRTGLDGSGIIFRDGSGAQNLTIRSQAAGIVELLGSGTDTIKIYGLAFAAFDQSATGQRILRGSGSPESVVTAAIGACYFDLTNGVAYMKKSGTGNTGWKLVTQAP